MSYDFKGKRVFLSGPMTGLDDWGREAFAIVELEVRKRGALRVLNPAASAPIAGEPVRPHSSYMIETLHELTGWADNARRIAPYYDVVVMMPGWLGSKGACIENVVAEACGIDIVEWEDEE